LPEGESSRRSIARWLFRVAGGILCVHYVFILLLSRHVSVPSLVLFLLAVACVVPTVRSRLLALPGLSRGWVRGFSFLLLLVPATSMQADAPVRAEPRAPHAFVGATILSGHRDAAPIVDGVVLVGADGRIVEVGLASETRVPDGYTKIDLRGKTLLPGLINAHGHLMLGSSRVPGEPPNLGRFALPDWLAAVIGFVLDSYVGDRVVLWLMERNAEVALRGGVTTLRGLGDPNFIDVELRSRIESGLAIGPRILAAGPLLCVTGGHAHQIGQVIDGADEARRAVRNSLRHQVDVIKIASTGGVSDSRRIGEAGELQMTPEEIAAVTDEAHRKNVLVAAHAESAQGVLEALRAGVDSIEHGAELDAEAIRLFKQNPKSLRGFTVLHPTLSVGEGAAVLTDEIRNDPVVWVMYVNGQEITRRMRTGFRQAVESGVKIGVGTDAGLVSHGSVWMEMALFVSRGGVSNADALYMGTLGTAEGIGVEDVTGSIDVGKYADFLVVDGDPLRDLATLADPAMVVASGRIYDARP
jgi:imidazolonepropionase-like amidohydrolase